MLQVTKQLPISHTIPLLSWYFRDAMNRVLLITGASRGIGAATARLAAERGYDVCVNYRRDREAAEAVVREVEARGARGVAVAADVAVEAEVVRLFDVAAAKLGPLAALVNNAGIPETQMSVEQMTAARLSRVFSVNVVGAFLCAREAVRRMSRQHGGQGGAIVNVSSVASRLGSPGEYVDYAASKGAIDTMTLGLAKEVAEAGIRVNAVRPGFIYPPRYLKRKPPPPIPAAATTSLRFRCSKTLRFPPRRFSRGGRCDRA